MTRYSGEAMTALRVTSEPVPAVVGMAIKGRGACVRLLPPPMTSRYSSTSPGLAARAAMALPASRALPPPKPMTRSLPAVLTAATPSRITSTVGSPETANNATCCASRTRRSGSSAAAGRPLTIRALRPIAAARGPICRSTPGPKRMRPAVANSKFIYQPASSGKRLAYLMLVRGSAIIPATVSRQRA